MRKFGWVVVLAGCGRVSFDALAPAAAGKDALIADTAMPKIGCSDGTREALVDQATWPTIAGCQVSWAGMMSLRTPRMGGACGNSLGDCASPADACATGWHICATSGDPTELSSRITGNDCAMAGDPGTSWVGAASHCSACLNGCGLASDCTYSPPYGCPATGDTCSEPVCCGTGCNGVNICRLGYFSDTAATNEACGASQSSTQTGVLCCAD